MFPIAAVPELDCTAAILSFGNGSLEIAILERMVFDLDCEALVVRIKRRPLRDRPRLENAVKFQAQIVMQARGVVLLDDEPQPFGGWNFAAPARLSGLREIAFCLVFRKF